MEEVISVLLIEDERGIRETIVEMMKKVGFKVASASTGAEGLNFVHRKKIDIVVCDIMMPEMSGFEFLIEMRKNPETELLPVIFLTAKVELEDKLHGLNIGANDYITKPFEIKELIVRVKNRVIEHRMLIQKTIKEPGKLMLESDNDAFLRRINQVLTEYIDYRDLDVNFVANKLNVSRSTLQKKIKRVLNKNITTFIREYRLKQAHNLLLSGCGNISEIAQKTGFNSVSYFSLSFKGTYGIAPSKLALSEDF